MTKQRNSWREEPWWHWDRPGRPSQELRAGNGGHALSDGDGQSWQVAAMLWMPTPDGWEQRAVYRELPAPAPKRKLGL